ncbi:hypothetical protein R6Q59_018046 [Mikania micrantha]
MLKDLFPRIIANIHENFEWFQQVLDVSMKKKVSGRYEIAHRRLVSLQPILFPANKSEYLAISSTTSAREYLVYFYKAIVILYYIEFLCAPFSHNITLLYNTHESKHDISRTLGSVDSGGHTWKQLMSRDSSHFLAYIDIYESCFQVTTSVFVLVTTFTEFWPFVSNDSRQIAISVSNDSRQIETIADSIAGHGEEF